MSYHWNAQPLMKRKGPFLFFFFPSSSRESEIVELKGQLGRMREDWIEEECHRVEAQLALKEARKEIKQLRQVVETMKNSLMEKDKGIQKYFIDINIQNRKLESLLHSMEIAQSGSNLDDPTLDYVCDSPEKSTTDKMRGGDERRRGEEEMRGGDERLHCLRVTRSKRITHLHLYPSVFWHHRARVQKATVSGSASPQ